MTVEAHMPACPWCGSTSLKLSADGLGGVSVCCTGCDCKGPPVAIDGECEDGDRNAIRRGSHRAPVGSLARREAIESVSLSMRLHALLGSALDEGSTVSVPYDALRDILEATTPARGAAAA